MILDRSQFLTKHDYLWHILNDLGCSDLSVCYSFRFKDGSLGFSKWFPYMTILHHDFNETLPNTWITREQFMSRVSHRTVLDIEVMIDIDDKGKFKSIKNKAKSIIRKLRKGNIDFACYFTGSKSYHISILFPELRYYQAQQISDFKRYFLQWIGADAMKSSSRSMIALEGEPHYKSGKNKELVSI